MYVDVDFAAGHNGIVSRIQSEHISDVVIPGWNWFRNKIFIIISEIDGSTSNSDSIKMSNHNIYQNVIILGLERLEPIRI